MDLNKAIRETREKMLNVLNTSGLPIEVLRLILNEILAAATTQANMEIEKRDADGSN